MKKPLKILLIVLAELLLVFAVAYITYLICADFYTPKWF